MLATIDSILMPARGYRFNVVQAAAGQLGARDLRVEDYWRAALGVEWHGKFPPHWCGAFALWALKQALLALDKQWHIAGCWPKHDSVGYGFILTQPGPLFATKTPLPGDISYKGAPFQHHALVEEVLPGKRTFTTIDPVSKKPIAHVVDDFLVRTIDGNQGPPLFIKRAQHWLSDAAYAHFSISPLIDEAEARLRAAA